MRLIIAENAGFCFGLKRAMEFFEEAIRINGYVYTLGPLMHNRQMIATLEARGARTVNTADDIPEGAPVIIRSHGVGRAETDILRAKHAIVYDATCPFVARIHEMADDAVHEGIPVIVIGDPTHPEVVGTLGWAGGNGLAVSSKEEAMALNPMDRALIVAQTTVPKAYFTDIADALITRIAYPDIRSTICSATAERQREATDIAARADVMLVVGNRGSSNTEKLSALCEAVCPRTYLIETADALGLIEIDPADIVGITAGASTPDGIFKEVVTRMNDIENQEQVTEPETMETPITETTAEPTIAAQPADVSENTDTAPAEAPQETDETTSDSDFMADVEKTLVQIRPGQTITGTVVQITEDEVCVNVGYKADGLVSRADLTSTDVKIGDEIEVEVIKVNDGDGNVLLSQRNIVNRKFWDALVAAHEAGECVTGTGKSSVKGGLIVDVNGIRVFVPASLLSLRYVEKIEEFIGSEMTLKIIEIDKSKKRAVGSRKAVLIEQEAERKRDIWGKLEEGAVVTGVVRRLTDFGAFVDIGGLDGLVHVTDLSWSRVGHPSDIVAVNQEIPVKILKIDPERDRISLSFKQTQPKPWEIAGEKYAPGMVVTGKVVRTIAYGAFVELEPGLDGMVHISQCALTRIAKVEDAVKVGEIIRVKILSVDPEGKRISLSIRELLEDEAFEGVNEEDAVLAEDNFAIPDAEPTDVSSIEDAPESEAAVDAAPEAEVEPENDA